jgi:hypothetical protein
MIEKEIVIHKNSELEASRRESVEYWRSKSPAERLGAVETYRREYWGEDYADKSGFPRVYSIVKHS